MDFSRTDVSGVPTFTAPAHGGLRAGLVFRVGRADETLATGGITHLVEHLALHEVGLSKYHYNGTTGQISTVFHTQGDAEHIVDFFAAVCRSLRSLPLDRHDTEKTILRTEARSRTTGVSARLLRWRYGPATYGLADYPEYGLHDLTGDEAQAWADRWFTRDNAAMWFAGGELPAGLRLDLPDGPRLAAPEASSALPRTPAFFTTDFNGVAFDAVVPRSLAARVYAGVLERRLHNDLRRNRGVSYTADTDYSQRDGAHAVVTALVDALPDKSQEVTDAFVDVLTDLALCSVPEEELRASWTGARDALGHPDALASALPGAAGNLLIGGPITTPAQLLDGLEAVTPDQVREVAEMVLDGGLLMVGPNQGVGRGGFTPAPVWSPDRVHGTVHAYAGADAADRQLIIGDDGVSAVSEPHAATVRFRECVGMLAWPDGARSLFAPDASSVHIEPTLWGVPGPAIEAIDRAVAPERVAWMPERAADSIPQPEAVEESAEAAAARREERIARVASYVVGAIFAVIVVGLLFAYYPITARLVLIVGVLVGARVYRRRRHRRGDSQR